MKKLTALALVLVLILSLAACGGAPAEKAPEAEAPKSDTPAPEGGAASEPVTLVMTNFDTAGTFNELLCQEFMTYVKEASGGSIDFTFYSGGTFCSMLEEYDFCSAGSIDCTWTYPGPNLNSNPWMMSVSSSNSDTDAVELYDFMTLTDPACSEIVKKYSANDSVIVLGTAQDGGSTCVSTFEFNQWDELKGHKNGATRDQDMYADMGHNVVALNQSDLYDSLSRGVCEFAVYNNTSILSNKLYEVAPYMYNTRVYANAMTLYFNLDKWNTLSAEQQTWLSEGAAHASQWANEQAAGYAEELKGLSSAWIDANDEDAAYIAQSMEQCSAAVCLQAAQNIGGDQGFQDMIYLTLVKEQWLGFDILPEEYASYRDSVQVTVNK